VRKKAYGRRAETGHPRKGWEARKRRLPEKDKHTKREEKHGKVKGPVKGMRAVKLSHPVSLGNGGKKKKGLKSKEEKKKGGRGEGQNVSQSVLNPEEAIQPKAEGRGEKGKPRK